jgi:repressor LexA
MILSLPDRVEMKNRLGNLIKSLRFQKGLTQKKLAELLDITPQHLYRIETGDISRPSPELLKTIAGQLNVEIQTLRDAMETDNPVQETADTLLTQLQMVVPRIQAYIPVNVPIRGIIPAGVPDFIEEKTEGYIAVPREELNTSTRGLMALRVSGNSLEGDNIHDGDLVIVEPDSKFINGKIYIVRINNEVVARHVTRNDTGLKLTSSNGSFKDMEVTDAEILGRIILSGRWQKL